MAARQTPPRPGVVAADPAQVIGIEETHLGAVGHYRVIHIPVDRHPVGPATYHLAVRRVGIGHRHTDRVLLGLGQLVGANEADHVVLPLVARWVALVAYLIDHVVQIVDRVHHRPHVGLLERRHGRDLKRLRLYP